MNTRIRASLRMVFWFASTSAVVALGLILFNRSAAFSQTDGVPVGDPVVLELFTSQGCSDCPPADALLSELGSSTKGVIPLAYHVDYWNHLGWSDPFSSHQFSERQRDYSRAMNLAGQYTPQMVVGGASQFVGSDAGGIERAISEAHSTSEFGRVSLHPSLDSKSPRTLRVKVKAQVDPASTHGRYVVMVAVYENGLVTKIDAGENAGREITYDYTVRKLVPAFELDGAQTVEKDVSVDLDPSWSANHLGTAAFIQNTSSLKIIGAASEYPIAGINRVSVINDGIIR
jgi:hypothetical protein